MRGSTVGLADGLRGLSRMACWYNGFLQILDTLFAALIVGPVVVSYWRGTWNLMGHYLFPENPNHSALASLAIGIIGHIVFTIFQEFFRQYFNPDKHRLTFYCGSRLYTSIFGIVCVNGWRGGWQLIDIYTNHNVTTIVVITVSVIFIMIALKTLRNITAPPFVIVTDTSADYFDIPTMYKTSGTREPKLYILDCLFSVLVIGSLVVFVWRGLWVLLDLRLFPENAATSAWASLIIGYIIVAVTFLLQPLMKWACERLEGFKRVLVADIFLFSSFVGTVNVWRGVWQLLDIYFLPDNKYLSDWLSHGLSLILLILLNCSNSVLVRGVYIDAEEPDGQCVVFPVYYIRLFFQKERTKKEQRMRDKLDKIEKNNAVLTEKPIMNHSSAPVTQNTIPTANKVDPEEVPIAKQSDDNVPEIHYVNDISKNNNNINIEPTDSSTTKM